jgi:hypothetical protein
MRTALILLSLALVFSGCKKASDSPDQVTVTIVASSVPAGGLAIMSGTYSNNSGLFNFFTDGTPDNPFEKSFQIPNHSSITVNALAVASCKESHLEVFVNGSSVASNIATKSPNGVVMAQINCIVSIK